MKKELAGWLLIVVYCTALSSPTGKSVFASAVENPESSRRESQLKNLDNLEQQKQETYKSVPDVLHVHNFRRAKGANGAGETARPKNKNSGGESHLLKPSSASAILRNAVTVLVACVFFF